MVGGVVYAGDVSQRDVGREQAYVSMLYGHLAGLTVVLTGLGILFIFRKLRTS